MWLPTMEGSYPLRLHMGYNHRRTMSTSSTMWKEINHDSGISISEAESQFFMPKVPEKLTDLVLLFPNPPCLLQILLTA